MDNYQKLVMPKKTKYRLTVVYVPLIDILTVLGFIALGLHVAKISNLPSIMQFVLLAFSAIAGIAAVASTTLCYGVPNWKVLFLVLKQDRNKYYPLYVRKEKENWEKE